MADRVQRIIILAGGPSPEAAVSRSSSAGVKAAFDTLGISADVWELDGDWIGRLAAVPRDGVFVFIGLHGAPGEDGSVQGVLDLLGLPYQGSGVSGSAVAMDKVLSRVVMAAAGVPVAAALHDEALKDPAAVAAFMDEHGKVVVKPVCAGSSVGVTIVDRISQWGAAMDKAAKHGPVLVEAFVPGVELTAAVLRGVDDVRVLPVIEITTPDDRFYDYASKYDVGGSAHVIPARVPAEVLARVETAALRAAEAVGARGVCRVDFRYDATADVLVAWEVNTLPGMTPTSLVPDAAKAVGMDYPALVRWMMEDGLAWHA